MVICIEHVHMFMFIYNAVSLIDSFLSIKRYYPFPLNRNSPFRSSRPEAFLRKGLLKICSKFTGEHPCRSAISINVQSNFIDIALRHGCSPVNFLHIFRTPFPMKTSGRLLLTILFSLFRKTLRTQKLTPQKTETKYR